MIKQDNFENIKKITEILKIESNKYTFNCIFRNDSYVDKSFLVKTGGEKFLNGEYLPQNIYLSRNIIDNRFIVYFNVDNKHYLVDKDVSKYNLPIFQFNNELQKKVYSVNEITNILSKGRGRFSIPPEIHKIKSILKLTSLVSGFEKIYYPSIKHIDRDKVYFNLLDEHTYLNEDDNLEIKLLTK
jgi:hypothetical protein